MRPPIGGFSYIDINYINTYSIQTYHTGSLPKLPEERTVPSKAKIDLRQELQDPWNAMGDPVWPMIRKMRQLAGSSERTLRLPLTAMSGGAPQLLGQLLAIAPGSVLFDPATIPSTDSKILLGPMYRMMRGGRVSYELLGLAPYTVEFRLKDCSSSPARVDQPPAICQWQMGHPEGEGYTEIYLTQAQWGPVRTFLHEWLPR